MMFRPSVDACFLLPWREKTRMRGDRIGILTFYSVSETVSQSGNASPSTSLVISTPSTALEDRLREKSLSRPKGEILLRSLTFVRDDIATSLSPRSPYSKGEVS